MSHDLPDHHDARRPSRGVPDPAFRRGRFLAVGSVAALGLAGWAGPAAADPLVRAAAAALPTVNMEQVVVASQVEPFRGDKPALNDGPDTRLVQSALRAKGFSVTVDGWFGSDTAAAYAGWQRRLGYSGLGANGIPGPSSLKQLGSGRFAVSRVITVGARSTLSGETVNARTRAMLIKADSLVGTSFDLVQGSYSTGVGASAGTHDGGGVVDISVSGRSTATRWNMVKALRTVGFAAWLRTEAQGFTPHIHAVAVGDTDMSTQARDQVADYYVGRNGLASHAADNTPSGSRVAFTWWERYRR